MEEEPKPGPEGRRKALRERAEARARRRHADVAELATEEIRRLVHELEVHQIELEIQNEELRQAQLELADSRDRYADLYDFAPVGYLTLDEPGRITEANLTAARLLGADRKDLIRAKLSRFVAPDSQDALHLHLQAVFSSEEKALCEVSLRERDGARPIVRLESLCRSSGEGATLCRTALVDLTDVHAAQQGLQRLNEALEQRVRKRTSELERSEHEFRTLAANVPALFSYVDRDLRYRYVNRRHEAFWGWPLSAVAGKSVAEVVGPRAVADAMPRIEAILRGEEQLYEMEVDRADGKRTMLVHGVPDVGPDGEVKGIFILSADITERKEAERRLTEHADALALLITVASMANEATEVGTALVEALRLVGEHNGCGCGYAWLVARTDPDQLILAGAWQAGSDVGRGSPGDLSSSARLRRGEGLAGRVLQTVAPEFSADPGARLSRVERELAAAGGGSPVRQACGFPIISGDRTVGVLELFGPGGLQPTERALGLMSSTGTLLGRVIERAVAARELRGREERLRAVLDTANDAIVTIDEHGTIVDLNRVTGTMFGYEREELLGENVNILMPEPFRDEHDGYLARYLETRDPGIIGVGLELVARRSDGKTFPVALRVGEVEPLRLFTGFIRDITERKRAEEDLRTGREELRQLSARLLTAEESERKRLSRDLHDDFNQRLALLAVDLESLSHEIPPSDVLRATLEQLRDRVSNLSDDVRGLAYRLHPAILDDLGLGAALKRLVEEFTASHPIAVSFRARLRSSLPPEVASCLYRIAQESLNNIAKHSDSRRAAIRLSGTRAAVRLTVRDFGKGFDLEYVRNHRRSLGVLSMEERARLQGGELSVESSPGEGTVVRVTVPFGNVNE